MTSTSLRAAVAQSSSDDGITFREILQNIPTDPASIFTLLLLLGTATLVVWAGRSKKRDGGAR